MSVFVGRGEGDGDGEGEGKRPSNHQHPESAKRATSPRMRARNKALRCIDDSSFLGEFSLLYHTSGGREK